MHKTPVTNSKTPSATTQTPEGRNLPWHISEIRNNKGKTSLVIDVSGGVGNGAFEKTLPEGWSIIETRWKTAPTLAAHETGIERVVLLRNSSDEEKEDLYAIFRITQTPRSSSVSSWNFASLRPIAIKTADVPKLLPGSNHVTYESEAAKGVFEALAKKHGYKNVTKPGDKALVVPWNQNFNRGCCERKYPTTPNATPTGGKRFAIKRTPDVLLGDMVSDRGNKAVAKRMKVVGVALRALLLPVAKKVGMTVGPVLKDGGFGMHARNHSSVTSDMGVTLDYYVGDGFSSNAYGVYDMTLIPGPLAKLERGLGDRVEELSESGSMAQIAQQLGNLHEAMVKINEGIIAYQTSQKQSKSAAKGSKSGKVKGKLAGKKAKAVAKKIMAATEQSGDCAVCNDEEMKGKRLSDRRRTSSVAARAATK